MERESVTYTRTESIEFLIDDDPEMEWLSSFDSSAYDRFFVILDEHVQQKWGDMLLKLLKAHKKPCFSCAVPAEEATKSLAFYPRLVKFLEERRCGLGDLVIAVGGGTVLDLVSFTCSTYMRGLPFFMVPTNLVGMVDASSAGKTCLSTEETKNLLGTFYYPLKVYSNVTFLETTAPYYERQGLSEIFKYGLLCSRPLLKAMAAYQRTRSRKDLKKMILLGMRTRIAIRKQHPQASNLGHTFGHAIEHLSGYEILHGDAITVGTVMALYFAKEEGLIKQRFVDTIIKMMKAHRLNIFVDRGLEPEKMVDAMMRDKKSTSKKIQLVLLLGITKPYKTQDSFFYPVNPEKMKAFLEGFLKTYPYAVYGCAQKIRMDRLTYR